MAFSLRRSLSIAGFVLWALMVAAGMATLWAYQNRPGPAAAAPRAWPLSSSLPRPAGRPALVMTLHPQCPCSHATLAELERLMAQAAERPSVHLLFVAPRGANDAWVRSGLWQTAARVPGVHLTRDDGTEAKRFGARVSGQVLVYDGTGRLQFSGGITGSRGHEGDNAGRDAIDAILAGRPHPASAYVFGCLLFDGDGAAAPWSDPT